MIEITWSIGHVFVRLGIDRGPWCRDLAFLCPERMFDLALLEFRAILWPAYSTTDGSLGSMIPQMWSSVSFIFH